MRRPIQIISPLLAVLSLAVSAHADVSDSGDLIIGGQGVVAGTMTVQGSAFSVGGGTFSVLAGTVNVGGLFKVSSAGIRWNDGTISTTAASGAGATVLYSSGSARFGPQDISATTLGVAFSTVTIADAPAGDYLVYFNTNNANSIAVCGVLRDGDFFGTQSASRGIGVNNGTTSTIEILNGIIIDKDVPAGSHSWALTCRVLSGSTTIGYAGIDLIVSQFGVVRVR